MNFVANFRASRKKRNIVFRNEGGGGGSEAVWKFSENSSKMVHTIVPKFGESPLHCTGDSDECFLHSTDFADISPHSQLKYPDDYNMKLLYGGKIKHRKNCECCPVSQCTMAQALNKFGIKDFAKIIPTAPIFPLSLSNSLSFAKGRGRTISQSSEMR